MAGLGQGGVTSRQAARAHEGATFEASCYTDPLGIEHVTGSLAILDVSGLARGEGDRKRRRGTCPDAGRLRPRHWEGWSMRAGDRRGGEDRRRDDGLSPLAAGLAVGAVLLLGGLISRRYSPDPSHPKIRRWYKRLDKPGYKPPDPVFAAGWPVLNTLQAAGAYRLLRTPRSPERDMAIALWLLSQALVSAYGKVAFGERSLTGGVVTATALVASCAAYVERAARIDPVAAALGVPIAGWSAFGDVLTEDLRQRNPEFDGHDAPELFSRPG